METRSRKRAEASSAAPSSSSSSPKTRPNKRSRLSSSTSTSSATATATAATTAVATTPIRSVNTRTRASRNKEPLPSKNLPPMDSNNESSSASRRDRRGKNLERDNSDKGKEKEHDVRIRERDAERGLALNMETGAGDEDDNDSDSGAGLLHQNLTSASSALQGLLRKLGAGLDDLLPSSGMGSSSHQNGRLKKILFGLRADGEEGRQVEALTQLCEMLSIGTEDSLSTFSVDSFVPVLVGLLNHESNPDIMLLAARALTHLCDVLPSSCAAVVHYGAVSIFCARLLTIEYMDLAEQSLQALKKISQEHPTACLRAGALMAVLSYLDFFSTGVQRVALSTAANMCKKLPSDAADFVMEAVPLLTNLLQYHDSKVLEHASVCLTRIAEAFASSSDKLDELCNHGLVTQAASLISNSSSGGGKNHTRRNVDSSGATPSNVSKEFKDLLMQALLQVEFPVLKILVEVFRVVAAADFVKHSLWPDLVPNLQSAIQNSHLINGSNSKWNTINALIVLHALIRPFQYFLNPKIAKEPVPPQLELIAKEILVPLLAVFHQFVGKAIANHDNADIETEKAILTICKCLHFTVKSYMPLTLAPLLNSFSRDLMSILSSLSFDCTVTQEDVYLTRWKSGKRSLLIFSSLVTRHRKHSDKLMPDIINNALSIVKFSKNTSILPFLLERILSLGFDVISNVLETGPGWRLVSPHFTTLLESAIFPALIMNEKDMSEWEEDADEYIRKNLPSDIDEISGWREDLFTARKSAVNLLGVISMSKGPPMEASTDSLSAKRKKGQKNKRSNQRRSMGELLVLPFLSKFPIPSDSNLSKKKVLNDYFGVLLAYGGLQEFLRDQESGFLTILIRTRILPLYTIAISVPHLIASANWVLGELGSCLPEEMSADVYSQLLMALVMPDKQDTSCYPVRVSAAGAITTLLDNDYMPPDFLPLLQVIVSNIGNDETDSSILFQLLSSIMEVGEEKISVHIPHIIPSLVGSVSKWLTSNLEPWPQVVERGIATLAVMGQTWEDSRPEVSDSESNDLQEKWAADQAAIGRAFAALLQQVWLAPLSTQDQQDQNSLTSSCIEDLSTLLRSVMLSIDSSHLIQELKVSELLPVWAEMIAEWHAWEESEDLSIFDVIKEIVNLDRSYRLKNFLVKEVPPPPAPPVPERSIVEGIGTFVSEAIKQYPSATYRACLCVHTLLHCPTYSIETEGVKQSLAIVFSRAAFSRFVEVRSTPNSLWKPLLLAISSCYLCYPEIVEGIIEKSEAGGITIWASALCHVSSSSFEAAGLTTESEMKLIVLTLARLIEQLLKQGKPCRDSFHNYLTSLMEVSIQLKELQDEKGDEEEVEEDDEAEEEDSDDDDSEDYDEDSEVEEYEETQEEFLERYAKAAVALEDDSVVEEGDVEDEELDMELGQLLDVDEQKIVLSLIDKYHHVLIQGQGLPSQLITSFLNAFPEHGLYFQQK